MFDARFHDSSSHINLTTNYVQQFMTKRWNQSTRTVYWLVTKFPYQIDMVHMCKISVLHFLII